MFKGFRLWKRINLGFGTINLQKGIPSLSLGPRGARYTIGRYGQRTTIGLPGTGVYYTRKSGDSVEGRAQTFAELAKSHKQDGNKVYFYELPWSQRRAIKHILKIYDFISRGDTYKALKIARKLPKHPDCLQLLGHLALTEKQYRESIQAFDDALKAPDSDCFYIFLCGTPPCFSYTIQNEITFKAYPDTEGYLIGLILALEQSENKEKAGSTAMLNQKYGDSIKLLAVEMDKVEGELMDNEKAKYIIDVSKGHAFDDIGLRLALYRTQAQSKLKLLEVALETITQAVRKAKNSDLLVGLRYQKGIVLKRLEKDTRALKEFQWVYCEDSTYKDIKERIK